MDSATTQPDAAAQGKPKEKIPADTSVLIKEAVLFGITILFTVLSGFMLRVAVGIDEMPAANTALAYFAPLLALLLFLTVFGFVLVLARVWWIALIASVIAGIVLFFILGPSIGMALGAILFVLLWNAAAQSVRMKIDDYLKIRIRWALKRAIPLMATALLLMATVRFYDTAGFTSAEGEIMIPQGLIVSMLKPVEGLIGASMPGFSVSDTSYVEYTVRPLVTQAAASLKGSDEEVPVEFDVVSQSAEEAGYSFSTADELATILEDPEAQDRVTDQMVEDHGDELASEFSNQLGIDIQAEDSVLDSMTKAANAQLNSLVGPMKSLVPFLIAFFYFLGLRIIAIPTMWISYFLAWILFKSLQHTSLFDVVLVKKPVEEVTLKTS